MKTSLIKRVAVGMSGGVDSSVAAALLIEQGYEVTGVFMECWRAPGCRVDEDRRDAMDVAMQLGIPFEVLDFKQAYRKWVVEYFYDEYACGRTPNPDTMCNREIKFGMFYDWAMSEGYDYVATGHYARVDGLEVGPLSRGQTSQLALLRGADAKKDQSYFLYLLRQEQLGHVLFPLGEMTKAEVRAHALEIGLATAEKPDSQGICFIGEVSVKEFLKDLGMEEVGGEVQIEVRPLDRGRTSKRLAVGLHDGAWFYTVGQKLGVAKLDLRFKIPSKLAGRQDSRSLQTKWISNLRIAGYDPARLPSFFVVEKDVENNVLLVGEREELMRDEFEVSSIHFVNADLGFKIDDLRDLAVRIRHGGELINIQGISRRAGNDKVVRLSLEKPVFGVAPGQACVFYLGEVVLGGGIITTGSRGLLSWSD